MNKGILALSAAALLLAGCGAPTEKLHIFTWSEYIDPELIAQFEEEHNCRVVIDIFDSNEAMLAKIQAGTTGYDILFPSSYMVEQLGRDGFIVKLDKSKIPNLRNIDPRYLECALDADMVYGVPYMVTYTGIAWRDDKVSPPPEPSWSVFETRPELAGRITLLGDMRETLGAALRYNGYSINTTNEEALVKARDTVIRWKKNIAKFENEQYKTGIAGGEFMLVHGYSGDIGQVQLDAEGNLAPDLNHVQFFLPKEGFSMSCDEMVIPVTAPNPDLAYAFINFLHDGAVAAQNEQYTTYWCPNTAAIEILQAESPEVLENKTIFPDAEDLKRGEVIGYLGDALAPAGTMKLSVLSGAESDYNCITAPDTVTPQETEAPFDGKLSLPAYSFTVARIPVKA